MSEGGTAMHSPSDLAIVVLATVALRAAAAAFAGWVFWLLKHTAL
jgi:hypothetical protein